MHFEIKNNGLCAHLEVELKKGEALKAESDAMVCYTGDIEITGNMSGGLMSSLMRSMLTQESLFMQTLTAHLGDDNKVTLAPVQLGDIVAIDCGGATNKQYILTKGSFLASQPRVNIDIHVQNIMKGLLSKEGFFLMKTQGEGTLFLSTYGSVTRHSLPRGKKMVVDNGHLVAWSSGIEYYMEQANRRSMFSSFSSGEGFVCRFIGPGEVFIQTRNIKNIHGQNPSNNSKRHGNIVNKFIASLIVGFVILLLLLIFVAILKEFWMGRNPFSKNMQYPQMKMQTTRGRIDF